MATPPPIVRVPTVARDDDDGDNTVTKDDRGQRGAGTKKTQEDSECLH